eukprot:TRINITY_DN8870_c0_g1_i1.p1 TRINITY_DN8870_c0_g1~~TRINITY_DN8870_c0_g1_i1.p1  ORF type:complete len:118 (-),score=6.81 TRINITY_DN8870_c0_g1_i1:155-508(-)
MKRLILINNERYYKGKDREQSNDSNRESSNENESETDSNYSKEEHSENESESYRTDRCEVRLICLSFSNLKTERPYILTQMLCSQWTRIFMVVSLHVQSLRYRLSHSSNIFGVLFGG